MTDREGQEPADLDELCRQLLAQGEAQRNVDAAAHRATLLEAGRLARQSGNTSLLAQTARAIARGFLTTTEAADPERIALVEAAVAAHRTDSPTRARLLASLAGERVLAGERTTAAMLVEEAVAVAQRVGDVPNLLMALATRGDVIFHPSTLDERHRLAADLEDRAARAGDDTFLWRAAVMGMITAIERGDAEAAQGHLDRAEERVATLDDPMAHFITALQRATWTISRGHLEEAERQAAAAHRLGVEARSDQADNAFMAQTIQIRTFQGQLEDTIQEISLSQLRLPAARAAYAFACAEAGHLAEASSTFASLVSHPRDPMPRDVTWSFGMNALAEVSNMLAAAQPAADLEAALAPYRRQHLAHTTYYLGPAAHPLGLLRAAQGDVEGADRLLVEAEASLASFGAPAHVARARLARCRVLALSSRRDHGRRVAVLARHGAGEARAAGFAALADQLEAHL